jgi:hypothetical protein
VGEAENDSRPKADGVATPFRRRQGLFAFVLLALDAPVLVSVGWPPLARAWPGLTFVYLVIALLAAFIALSWLFARVAFAAEDAG